MKIQIIGYSSEVFRYPKADRNTLCAAYKRLLKRRALPTILEGDWVQFDDGFLRVSYVWYKDGVPEGIQTTTGGSFYLGEGGGMSMSGALMRSIPFECFTSTNENKMGSCWFFYNEMAGAHRACQMMIPCKIWTVKGPKPLY